MRPRGRLSGAVLEVYDTVLDGVDVFRRWFDRQTHDFQTVILLLPMVTLALLMILGVLLALVL